MSPLLAHGKFYSHFDLLVMWSPAFTTFLVSGGGGITLNAKKITITNLVLTC